MPLPKPHPEPKAKVNPEKMEGETPDQHKKRMQAFLDSLGLEFSERKKEWQQELNPTAGHGTITFVLPQDEKAFAEFMRQNPDTKLILNCDRAEQKNFMGQLKKMGFMDNVQGVNDLSPSGVNSLKRELEKAPRPE